MPHPIEQMFERQEVEWRLSGGFEALIHLVALAE